MSTILTLHDPLGICRRETDIVPEGTLLLGWLIERFGPGGFDIPTTIYKNRVVEGHEIDLSAHVSTGMPLGSDDVIIICRTPQGLDPFTIGIIYFVVALAFVALTPRPRIPDFQQAQQSPNNSLTAQTNIARPLQRIPDIYGKNRVYPDIIANSYFEFINHIKHLTEYLCVGRGSFLVEDIKSGETLISDIPNSSAVVYEPFTRPSELLSARQSNSVDGQEVFGPNVPTMNLISAVRFTGNDTFTSTCPSLASFQDIDIGDTFTISGATDTATATGTGTVTFNGDTISNIVSLFNDFSVGQIINVSGTTSNNGQYEIKTQTATALTCIDPVTGVPTVFTTEINVTATISAVYDNDGTYTLNTFTVTVDLINTPPDPTIYTVVVDETTFSSIAVANDAQMESTSKKDDFVGPFIVPGTPDQIWINIEFPRGLENNGDVTTVLLNLQLQEVDGGGAPIGAAEPHYFDFTDGTVDLRAYTRKLTPANPGGLYTVQVFRITNEGDANDSARWTGLFGMEGVTATDFGDVTTVLINTRATTEATRAQERKFNAVVTRKLVTYENGARTTVEQPTARMADAMLDILTIAV